LFKLRRFFCLLLHGPELELHFLIRVELLSRDALGGEGVCAQVDEEAFAGVVERDHVVLQVVALGLEVLD